MDHRGESSLEFDVQYQYKKVKTDLIDLSDLRKDQLEVSEMYNIDSWLVIAKHL